MTSVNQLFTTLLVSLMLSSSISAIDTVPPAETIAYEVKQVYKPLSISKEKLKSAQSISDLNKHYKADWVKEYRSVTIIACIDGITQEAQGKTSTLTTDQIELMSKSDAGSDISVSAVYLPDNNLKSNDIHEMGFTFMINPEVDAQYPEGERQLNTYIKESVEEKLIDLHLRQYQLAVVTFKVAEDGSIQNPTIFASTEDEESDNILLKAIKNMPNWEPAHYEDGTLIEQEYALTVGDNQSCTANLLNLEEN